MEIKNTFAYFRNKANYEAAKSASGYNGDTIGSTSNTIVFVEGQGDTPGEIWTHGKQFGGGISESQITNAINNYFENQEIGDIIPDASYDNKGIVSIQRNGGINVNNGVISADLSNVVTLDGNQTITGTKTFSQNVTSTGFKVQDKNNNYVVLAGGGTKPLSEIIGTGGEGGTQYVENPYDDAWINTELSTINGNITGLRNDLNAVHNWSASEVNAAVKDAFQDWTWFKAYADANGLTGTTWSIDEYSDELGQWLRGVINVSDVGGAWSTLTQKVNSLEATVTSLSTGGATPEEIAELVSSNLGLSVDEINGLKTSVAKLTTMWADSPEKEAAATWLISGYNSITNKTRTLAQLFSDAETNATNGATSAATALVQTEVNRIDGEITNVKATLGTKLDTTAVNGLITQRTAGFVSQTDLNSAVSQMSAKISENDSDYYAAVKASVNKYLDENGNDITSTIAEMVAASENGESTRLASVFVKDDELAGQVAGILASDGDAKANVIAAVKNGKSSLGLTADDIIFEGNTTVKGKLNLIEANSFSYSDLTEYGMSLSSEGFVVTGYYDVDNWHSTKIAPGYIQLTDTQAIDRDKYYAKLWGDGIEARSFSLIQSGNNVWAKRLTFTWTDDSDGKFDEITSPNNIRIKPSSELEVTGNVDIEGNISANSVSTNSLNITELNSTEITTNLLEAKDILLYDGSDDDTHVRTITSQDATLKLISQRENEVTGNINEAEIQLVGSQGNIRLTCGGDGSILLITKDLRIASSSDYTTHIYSNDEGTSFVCADHDRGFNFDSDLNVAGSVYDSSDSTLKDIVSDTTLTVEQIANAPAVNFTWKKDADKENKKELVGTLAQYWQVVLPQVVGEGKDGKLNMQYGNAAMVSSIVTAKEVVALKERIAELERKLNELTSNQ